MSVKESYAGKINRRLLKKQRIIAAAAGRAPAELVLETGYKIKPSYDGPERLLELLLLQLAQEGRNG